MPRHLSKLLNEQVAVFRLWQDVFNHRNDAMKRYKVVEAPRAKLFAFVAGRNLIAPYASVVMRFARLAHVVDMSDIAHDPLLFPVTWSGQFRAALNLTAYPSCSSPVARGICARAAPRPDCGAVGSLAMRSTRPAERPHRGLTSFGSGFLCVSLSCDDTKPIWAQVSTHVLTRWRECAYLSECRKEDHNEKYKPWNARHYKVG